MCSKLEKETRLIDMKKLKYPYLVHLRPSIDVIYQAKSKNCNVVDKELEKVIKNAIKNNEILKSKKVKLKYISMGESYIYKKNNNKDNNHPNFIIMDNV